jgi:hypothetical protein
MVIGRALTCTSAAAIAMATTGIATTTTNR